METKKTPKRIKVVIPPQEYSSEIYTRPCGCYLFQALEKLNVPVKAVGSNGRVHMRDESIYYPEDHFDSGVLIVNFEKGIETELILVKS